MDRRDLGPILTTGQLSRLRTILLQLERSGSLLDLATNKVATLLREIDTENTNTKVLVSEPPENE